MHGDTGRFYAQAAAMHCICSCLYPPNKDAEKTAGVVPMPRQHPLTNQFGQLQYLTIGLATQSDNFTTIHLIPSKYANPKMQIPLGGRSNAVPCASGIGPFSKEFDAYVEHLRDIFHVPSMQIGIVSGDETFLKVNRVLAFPFQFQR